jgi:hypothetical protein
MCAESSFWTAARSELLSRSFRRCEFDLASFGGRGKAVTKNSGFLLRVDFLKSALLLEDVAFSQFASGGVRCLVSGLRLDRNCCREDWPRAEGIRKWCVEIFLYSHLLDGKQDLGAFG